MPVYFHLFLISSEKFIFFPSPLRLKNIGYVDSHNSFFLTFLYIHISPGFSILTMSFTLTFPLLSVLIINWSLFCFVFIFFQISPKITSLRNENANSWHRVLINLYQKAELFSNIGNLLVNYQCSLSSNLMYSMLHCKEDIQNNEYRLEGPGSLSV